MIHCEFKASKQLARSFCRAPFSHSRIPASRSLYAPIVRALGVLLSAGVASALFKWRYFDYTLLDITDYEGTYKFCIDCDFAVPLLLFVVAHCGIGFSLPFHAPLKKIAKKDAQTGRLTLDSVIYSVNAPKNGRPNHPTVDPVRK